MIHLKITRKDTTIKGESKGLKGIKKKRPLAPEGDMKTDR